MSKQKKIKHVAGAGFCPDIREKGKTFACHGLPVGGK